MTRCIRPCGCTLDITFTYPIRPQFPCLDRETELEFKQLLPAGWFKIKTIRIPSYVKASYPRLEMLSESLDRNMVEENNREIILQILVYILYGITSIRFTYIFSPIYCRPSIKRSEKSIIKFYKISRNLKE